MTQIIKKLVVNADKASGRFTLGFYIHDDASDVDSYFESDALNLEDFDTEVKVGDLLVGDYPDIDLDSTP